MSIVGGILLVFGMAVLLLASVGLFVLPEAMARQHAATKAGSLGIACIALGAGFYVGEVGWVLRATVIVVVVWATLPVASHVLARAALREQGGLAERERGAPLKAE